jgi:hypothetical protein
MQRPGAEYPGEIREALGRLRTVLTSLYEALGATFRIDRYEYTVRVIDEADDLDDVRAIVAFAMRKLQQIYLILAPGRPVKPSRLASDIAMLDGMLLGIGGAVASSTRPPARYRGSTEMLDALAGMRQRLSEFGPLILKMREFEDGDA